MEYELEIPSTKTDVREAQHTIFVLKKRGDRMPNYVINKNQQANGDHEVHDITNGCSYMPASENQISLGYHPSCQSAVLDAKRRWPGYRINGCYYCCKPCHTS